MTTARSDHDIMYLLKVHDVVEGNKLFWNQKNLTTLQITKSFLQFIADYLHREYDIIDGDVENVDDILACKIFNSDISHESSQELNYKQFITLFFNKAFEFDRLDKIIECTRQLVTSFLENQGIPEDDEIRGNCCVFTSFFLEPLADYWINNNDSLDLNLSDTLVELNIMIPLLLETFSDIVSSGVIYKNICVHIVTEYCMVFEKNPELLIKMLPGYKCFLEIDHPIVLTATIKSLIYLCTSNYSEKDLLNFFHDKNKDGKVSVSEMLFQLACEKQGVNFTAEILQLFNKVTELDGKQQMLSKLQRLEIYKNNLKFYGHKAIMKEVFIMMKLSENCMLRTLVDLFNVTNANGKVVEKVIKLLIPRDISIASVVEFIIKTVFDDPRCIRACQIFKYVYSTTLQIDESFFANINNHLYKCSKNEHAFGTICKFITLVDDKQLSYLLVKRPKVMAQVLDGASYAFRSFECPKVLAEVFLLIKCLKELIPATTKTILDRTIKHFYEELIEIDAMEIAEIDTKKCFEGPLIKLTMMFESDAVILNDYFEYDTLFVINRRHLENKNDKYYPHFARFQAVLLKFSFNLIVKRLREEKGLQFPLTLEDVLTLTSDLREKLLNLVKEQKLFANIYEAKQILTSIFSILYDFHVRPIMINSTNSILCVRQPKIDMQTYKTLIESVYINICTYQEETPNITNRSYKYNDLIFSRQILNSLLEFFIKYVHPVDYTPTFKIISLLYDDNLKNPIINILKFLQGKPAFMKILALSIMSFVIEEERNVHFPAFALSINEFFINQDIEYLEFDVVEVILKNLPMLFKKVSKSKNRLLILKNIQKFMPELIKGELQFTEALLLKATKDLQLRNIEQNTLFEFLNKYRNGVVN